MEKRWGEEGAVTPEPHTHYAAVHAMSFQQGQPKIKRGANLAEYLGHS